MVGPCLCGDPYCPSCGNPALAEFETAMEDAMDRIADVVKTPEELTMLLNVGITAVMNARELQR